MNKKNVKNECFNYNGENHRIGTRFIMKYNDKEVTARFLNRFDSDNTLGILIENGLERQTITLVKEENLKEVIVEILPINWYTEMDMKKKYVKDSDMPELVIGWIFYIVIMLILIIFNDRIIGWIAVIIYCFKWRHKKKEEEGTYFD